MKTIVKFTALFCSIIPFLLFAQISPPGEQQNPSNLKTGSSQSDAKTVGYSQNSGSGNYHSKTSLGRESSFYLCDWSPGKVVLKDQTVLNDYMLRYDIYHRQMQFAVNGDTGAFGKPDEIESITINNKTFIYDEFQCKDGNRKDYLELLVDGDCRLFAYRCISYKLVDECTEPGLDGNKQQYFQTMKYFISNGDEVATLVPENKNNLIEILSDKDKDIRSFIKDNNIKINVEADLVKLVSFYNQ